MRRDSGSWVRVVAGALAVIVSAVVATPAFATEPAPVAPAAKPLSTAVAAKLAAMPAPVLKAQDPAPAAASSEGRGFFRSPKGVAAVVLMAAGLGYTVYSIKNDRDPVKSPIR